MNDLHTRDSYALDHSRLGLSQAPVEGCTYRGQRELEGQCQVDSVAGVGGPDSSKVLPPSLSHRQRPQSGIGWMNLNSDMIYPLTGIGPGVAAGVIASSLDRSKESRSQMT